MASRTAIHAMLASTLLIVGLDAGIAAEKIPARTDFGATQLAAIQARYEATPNDCGGPDKPAFLCSTVLFRFTSEGDYHVWNPSPTAISLESVSFAYLRADINFGGTPWDDRDGLIFSPATSTDGATLHPEMLCIFPIEAHTWYRQEKGCGYSTQSAYGPSQPCQRQSIFTAAQWVEHARQAGAPIHPRQCGFTIKGAGDPAAAFLAAIKARALLPDTDAHFPTWNELLVETWPQDIGASLPIEAFFYVVMAGRSGLAGARRNQRDLLQTAGVAVPVIRIDLPTAPGGKSYFAYDLADQAIPIPSLPASLDTPPTVVQAPTGMLRVADILARNDIQVNVPALPGIAAGSTGRVRWVGERTFYETPAQPVAAAQPTLFAIPRGSVLAALGQPVFVSFVVTDKALSVERTSPVFPLKVENASDTLPPPVVAPDHSSVTVGYPGMLATDQITVAYEGHPVTDMPFPKKAAPFQVAIASSMRGWPDQVYYWVKRGTQYLVSPVVTPTRKPWPILPDAANGWLDFKALNADPTVTVAPWDGILAGQSVWLDALAYMPDGTEQRAPLFDGSTVDATIVANGLRASLSRDWLRRLPDGSAVFLRTRVAAQGGNPATARAFPVTRFTLRNAPGPIVTKPLPRLVDLLADGTVLPIDGLLSRSALKGSLQARVAPWPGMLAGQRVWLRVRGRTADGSELLVDLAPDHVVAPADLANGLIRPVPIHQFDALADQSPLILELKVGFDFEKFTDEAHALRFPIDHLTYAK